jgi:periplasmic divalent cation tolerance protein
MDRAVFVYTTYPSIVEAEKAGRGLVERRLAACVNILPGMISHYRWQGAIERAEEVVMIIKTRASLADQVREAVKRSHSYTTPAILVLPIEGGDPAYLDWLMTETRPAVPSRKRSSPPLEKGRSTAKRSGGDRDPLPARGASRPPRSRGR